MAARHEIRPPIAVPTLIASASWVPEHQNKEGGPGGVDVTASDLSCAVYSNSPVDWVMFAGPRPNMEVEP